MKKIYILASLLVFSCFSQKTRAQTDTLRAKKVQLEFLYNQYIQEGNNSAVTGGIGTEKLRVYGPSLSLKSEKGRNTWNVKAGSDIISSASTDNIDSIKSSASILDSRSYAQAGITRSYPSKSRFVDAGVGFSLESDYRSFSYGLGMVQMSRDGLREWEVRARLYQDDLRWGWLDPEYYRPVKLIYADDLRWKEWYSTHKRRSLNINTGVTQVLNRRNVLGVFLTAAAQRGLLATPFHRVIYSNDSVGAEQLPEKRNRISLGVQWNTFIGGRVILKTRLDGYTDDFGIRGLAFEQEAALKLNYKWTLLPGFRLYTQQGSNFFAPYREHRFGVQYASSDYDLSTFNTLKWGCGIKHIPQGEHPTFNYVVLRYHRFSRSNGLSSHIASLLLGIPL